MKKIKDLNKMRQIFSSYALKKESCRYSPLRIWLEPTDKCNLACPFCINKDLPEEGKGYMEWGLFRKIIDEMAGEICDINLFHRGESLLHPRIVDMVAYIREKNLNSRLHTNATQLTEKMSRALLKAGLNYISFSFDGFDKETYEKNRVNAVFDKTLNNIVTFLKIKKELSAGTFVVLQIIDSNIRNKEKKEDFLGRFKGLPLDKVSVRTPHNWGGGLSETGIEKTKKPISCTFPWYGLTVFRDGKVVPCCQDYMGKIMLGDANVQGLKEIWNSDAMKKLRADFKKKDYGAYAPCLKCDRIWRKNIFGIPVEYIGTFLREARIRS
jgi:radical SAM protein with 4Fe4S-binding SPASM domain